MIENTAVRVDPSNVGQLGAWDGDQGAYWTARADRFDEGVAGYHGQFLAAAAIEATANVLDIGCGNGQQPGMPRGVPLPDRHSEWTCPRR